MTDTNNITNNDANTNNDAHTNGDENSVFHLNTSTPIDPGQMTMFETTPAVGFETTPAAGVEAQSDGEPVTEMDIPHNMAQEDPASAEEIHEDEKVSSGTKIKILATLVIVGIAGYAAYWVQEPIQLKTDFLDSNSTISGITSTDADLASNTVADSGADSTATDQPTGQSTSVDVSLFGFDPATLTVDKGTTVVWTNTSTEDQTIIGTSSNGESFASPVLTSGQTFSYKFDQDADFEYYSTYNPALKATIKVGAGDNVTSDSTSTEAVATSTGSDNSATENATTTVADIDSILSSAFTPETTVTSDVPPTVDRTAAELATLAAVTAADQALHEAAPTDVTTPSKLSKTGPAEDLYMLMLIGIIWLNRKKLAKVFQK